MKEATMANINMFPLKLPMYVPKNSMAKIRNIIVWL